MGQARSGLAQSMAHGSAQHVGQHGMGTASSSWARDGPGYLAPWRGTARGPLARLLSFLSLVTILAHLATLGQNV